VSPGETTLGTPGSPVWHHQDDAIVGGLTGSIPAPGFAPLFYQTPDDGLAPFPFSEDMAFRLYTNTPEPGSIVLFGMGAMGLAAAAYRRRRARVR
jgi:hypothetical protein